MNRVHAACAAFAAASGAWCLTAAVVGSQSGAVGSAVIGTVSLVASAWNVYCVGRGQ